MRRRGLLLCIILMLWTSIASAASLVQSKIESTAAFSTSHAFAFTSNIQAGSLIVVACTVLQDVPSTTNPVISDTQSNSYTLLINRGVDDPTTNQGRVYVAYAQNAAAGATTVTCDPPEDLGGSGAFITLVIAEFSGMLTSGVADQSTSNSSGDVTGTAVSSGTTGTTAQADELVIGIMTYRNIPDTTIAEGGSYAVVQEQEAISQFAPISVIYKFVAATGTQSATWTLGAAHRWAAGIATFKSQAVAGKRRMGATFFP